jgi:hypothetical protein
MSVSILSRPTAPVAADRWTIRSGTIESVGAVLTAESRHYDTGGSRLELGLFDRFRGRGSTRADGCDPAADLRYLSQWVAEHHGVEAFVEPKTTVTEVTVVLVAADGEWTRRRAGGDSGARRLSDRLNIPVYDVQKVGYPQRMRDYDARQRVLRDRERRRELEAD